MSAITASIREIHTQALCRANEVRVGMADAKREVRARRLTFAQALEDPRVQPMEIGVLILAVGRWGPTRTRKLLAEFVIGEQRRVEHLTANQRAKLTGRIR